MVFNSNLITPQQADISKIEQVSFDGGRNIMVYSFAANKKSHYLSHVYQIDDNQTGKEFIYGPKGEFVAEFPLFEGKAHGKGKVAWRPDVPEEQHFYYGEVFPTLCNDEIKNSDGDPIIIDLSVDLSGFDKEKLMPNKLPDYILNFKEKQMKAQFTFDPVAQNTVIRPLAQAVCMAHGGEDVSYVDTADHKTKTITVHDLYYLTLQLPKNGKKINVDGNLVAFRAQHEDIAIRVNVNDVFVMVSRGTTVNGAMTEFKRKIAAHNKKRMRCSESRQHE